MSAPRHPLPKPLIPAVPPDADLAANAELAASGEYRIASAARKRSSTTMKAVRPETRRPTSKSFAAVSDPRRTAVVPPRTQSGPRRYETVQMQAIAPRRARAEQDDSDFDFDFDFDADGALDLDCRPSPQRMSVETPRPSTMQGAPPARASGQLARVTPPPMARVTPPPIARVTPPLMPRPTPGPMLPPAPAWPMASSTGRRPSVKIAAVDPHAALVAFSGFGDPPTSVWGTPGYALRVIARRRTLRRDLKLARLRHSHDVGLYEASLRTADDGAVRNGVLVTAFFFTMMTVLAWTLIRVLSGTHALPWW